MKCNCSCDDKSHFGCMQKLMAEGGPSRFYRGFTPCLMRAAPANGVMLYTVDKVTQLLNS